jgi:hypothetical protein
VGWRPAGGAGGAEPRLHAVGYGRADTSLFSYVGVRRPDGTIGRHLLDAGTNPPAGALIHYYLHDEPAGELTLEILDAGGYAIRSFSSRAPADAAHLRAPARRGLNRFVWSLRYPGAPRVEGHDLEPWHRDHGPLVIPGTYQVRLTVGDRAAVQPLEVVADPRITAGAEALRAQHDLLHVILGKLATTNELINRVDALQAQAGIWQRWIAEREGAEAIRADLQALQDDLAELKPRLIDVHMRQAQLHPSGLHEKLNALFDVVDGADYAPTQQARDVLAALSAVLEEQVRRFEDAVTARARAVNEAIRAAGIPALGALS